MKVLMVAMGMDIGGAETHIVELCRAFAARGITVFVASAGGVYADELEKIGIRHMTLPLNKKTPMSLMIAKNGLAKLIEKEKFDIVHAHARIPAFICGKLRKKYGFRFVTTDHLDFRLTPLLKKLTDWGEFTFAVSEDLRQYLLRNFHVNPKHIALTVNGINTEKFCPCEMNHDLRKTWNTEGRTVLLHISRLEEHLSVCVRALMGAVGKLNGKAMLIVIGDGSYADILKKEAEAYNAEFGYQAILFAGATTDVKGYIAASDIVIAPSRAAMEAMACGKPTIVSGSQGHGGIFREEIIEGAVKSNFCFRGAGLPTAEILTDAINEILAMDNEEKTTLGIFGREFIKKHYSVDVMAETQLAGYEKVLQCKIGGAPDVLICGYYGYGNTGDETLLSVITAELRKREPTLRICALSADPEQTRVYNMIDAVPRFDLVKVTEKMKQTKLFLFGGGNLLQDKTSTHSLLYYTNILHMAKKNGAKVMVYANGIGPLRGDKNIERVKNALADADSISLRDKDSFVLVKSFDPEKPARLTFDPAILAEKEQKNTENEPYFVIAPKITFPDNAENLKELIRYLKKETHMKPIVVSMYDSEDLDYAKKIAMETGAEMRFPKCAEGFVSLFSGASLVISSRLHGLVYATAAVCPMMGYSDDGKLFSYLEYIGFGKDDPIPCAVSVHASAEFMQMTAMKILSESVHCRAEMQRKLPSWRALASYEFAEALRLMRETSDFSS
ncbi:MAG: polysaccharide pyruvyl transferase CsaB [Clostridia bacterium]|nr:polysaccharide pyruvyl transferase CsaB [Clostridia bacterium]